MLTRKRTWRNLRSLMLKNLTSILAWTRVFTVACTRASVAVSLLSFVLGPHVCSAQAAYTASRAGDLQVGGQVVFAQSQYEFQSIRLTGGGLYASFDWREHLGAEIDFRHAKGNNDDDTYERTYEVGARYIVLHKFGLAPYVKALYGRGVYNYPYNVANLAFNLYSLGAGTDFRLSRSLNLRADYEHQSWWNVPLQNPQPNLISVGVAYHFHER